MPSLIFSSVGRERDSSDGDHPIGAHLVHGVRKPSWPILPSPPALTVATWRIASTGHGLRTGRAMPVTDLGRSPLPCRVAPQPDWHPQPRCADLPAQAWANRVASLCQSPALSLVLGGHCCISWCADVSKRISSVDFLGMVTPVMTMSGAPNSSRSPRCDPAARFDLHRHRKGIHAALQERSGDASRNDQFGQSVGGGQTRGAAR